MNFTLLTRGRGAAPEERKQSLIYSVAKSSLNEEGEYTFDC